MTPVTIHQQPYFLEYHRGHFGGFHLILSKERRCRGWRGWLGHTETIDVGWLEVEQKGTDYPLCQSQQGIFARAHLEIHPDWQGQGLGTYLLRQGIREARKDGAILAGSLEGEHPERLWKWFLERGMDIVRRDDQGGQAWVLGRTARAAQASVLTTRLVLAEPPEGLIQPSA